MTKIDCPTCEGVGLIYDRRVDNRDEEEIEEEELEYINVNWDEWNQQKNALVEWVQLNHPELDGFVNDMTIKGAMDYLKAIELYEKKELLN